MADFVYPNYVGMTIADAGVTSQTVHAYGMVGSITSAHITFEGLEHGRASDLDMLLVAPNGTSNLEFWSDAGGSDSLSGNYTVYDPVAALPSGTDPSGHLASGSYGPADYGPAETNSEFGSSTGGINSPASGATFASSFGGVASEGDWTLYIADDASGFSGSLTDWQLDLTTDSNSADIQGTSVGDQIEVQANGDGSGQYDFVGDPSTLAFFHDVTGTITVDAGAGADEISATGAGLYHVYGGTGDDTLDLWAPTAAAGSVFDGGTGTDLFRVFSVDSAPVVDLRAITLTNLQTLELDPFLSSQGEFQIDANQFAANFTSVTTSAGAGQDVLLSIFMDGATSLDLSGVAFTNFNATGDHVTITGGSAAETITGSVVDDVIIGGGGADTETGEAGADTFAYNTPSDFGDIITDFSNFEGDKITLGGSAHTLADAGVDFVLGDAPRAAVSTLMVDRQPGLVGPGRHRRTNAAVKIADVNGLGTGHTDAATPGDGGWTELATGDFNHDGHADVLWRHDSDGATAAWLMGADGTPTATPSYLNAAGWSLVAHGDFDGNGTADLMWQQGNTVAAWLMNSDGTVGWHGTVGSSSGWTAIGQGDFDGSGTTDLLWQAPDGTVGSWLLHAGGPPRTPTLFQRCRLEPDRHRRSRRQRHHRHAVAAGPPGRWRAGS